jgi:hypothetical protein
MLVAMSEQDGWRGEADIVAAYRRWRELLRRGWRRYMELLGEAGVLWPEGASEDAAFLEFALPDLPDLYTVEALEAFAPGGATSARGQGREVTESSARRRPSDGIRSSSVQHPSLPSSN